MNELEQRQNIVAFTWKTQDGELLSPPEMKTTHLFYSLRMIWNHSMPEEYHLPGGRYNIKWVENKIMAKTAIMALSIELATRDFEELTIDLQWQWQYMLEHAIIMNDLLEHYV